MKFHLQILLFQDCGSIFSITDGTAVLDAASTTFGSTAKVICNIGYETNKVEIKCQETGAWETAVCVKKGRVSDDSIL